MRRFICETDTETHTMGMALSQYVDIKIHPHIKKFSGNRIIVRGKYTHRNDETAKHEKTDKKFNWKRAAC